MKQKFLQLNHKVLLLISLMLLTGGLKAQIANQTIDTITNNTISEYLDNNAMVIDDSNTVHLIFTRDTLGIQILKYTKRPCGSGWTPPVTISNPGEIVYTFAIDVTSTNQPYVAYEIAAANGNIILATETSGTWSTTAITNNSTLHMDVDIAIDGSDYVHLAWITEENQSTHRIAYATNRSGTWNIQNLQNAILGSFGTGAAPYIAVTSGGVAHITFRSGAYSSYEVEKITNSVPGGTTWTLQLLSTPLTYNFDGVIVIDQDSTIHVAINGNNGLGPGWSPRTYYTKQVAGSTVWSTPQLVDVSTTGSVYGMDVDTNGKAHIVYEEVNSSIRTGAIYYSTNANGSSFIDTVLLDNTTSYGGVIRLNNDGVKYIASFSNNFGVDNEIYVIRNGLCTLPPQMPVADFSADKTTICVGDTITFTDLSTGPPVSRVWTFAGGAPNSSGAVSPKVVYNTAGVYDVILNSTNSVGTDTETKTGYITVLAEPVASAGEDATICAGSSAQLFASGGASYLWSPAAGLSDTTINNPVATPAATTNYIVTVTGANGCKAKDTLKVTVNPIPNADAGNNKLICAGSSTQLAATGGTTYLWSPAASLNNPSIANPVATPSVTTTYSVTASTPAGCSASDTVRITVIAAPVANAGADVTYCSGTGVQLNASGGVSYSWSPATGLSSTTIANPLASPSVTTDYIVTVFNNSGCSAKDTVKVSVAPPLVATASADVAVCAGSGTTLSASGGTTYLWSPATGLNNASIQNPTASPGTTTTYTVTVSDGNGCSSTDDVKVTVNPLPTAIASADVTICTGSSSQLSASGGVQYSWSPATGLNNAFIANPVASPNFTTTYTVSVTDVNTCLNTDVVTVTINPAVVASVNNDTTVCLGQPVQLKANGGDSYLWSPSTGLNNPSIATPIALPAATTNYMVIVSKNNCLPDTAYVSVTVSPAPVITFNPATPTVCEGASVQLMAAGGTSYSWSPAASLNNAAIPNPIASPKATTTYTVTTLNSDGCAGINTLTVNVLPVPNVMAGNDVSICIGESANLSASGATTYSWSPSTGIPNPNIAHVIVSPTNTTNYIVTGTATNGCEDNDTVLVTVNPVPSIPMINQSGNILSVSSTYNGYQWYLNGNIINGATGATHTITQAGNYTVVVNNEFGCSATSAVHFGYGVGINELADGLKVDLFGYGKYIYIKFEKPVQNYKISIVNVIGQELYSGENLNQQYLEVNLPQAAAGIYLVTLDVKGQKIVRKVHLN